jgi:hypothetical protein
MNHADRSHQPEQTAITAEETALVNHALRSHPHASHYRLSVQADSLVIYGRAGFDLADMLAAFGGQPTTSQPRSGFRPLLRLLLVDAQQRHFRAAWQAPPISPPPALAAAARLPDLLDQMLPLLPGPDAPEQP